MGYEYVRFQRGSQAAYEALKKANRLDENTLYFIYDDDNNSVGALYMGARIISSGDVTIASASLDDLTDVIISATGENSFLVQDASKHWVSKSFDDVISLKFHAAKPTNSPTKTLSTMRIAITSK